MEALALACIYISRSRASIKKQKSTFVNRGLRLGLYLHFPLPRVHDGLHLPCIAPSCVARTLTPLYRLLRPTNRVLGIERHMWSRASCQWTFIVLVDIKLKKKVSALIALLCNGPFQDYREILLRICFFYLGWGE